MEAFARPEYLEALAFTVERHGLVCQARKGTDFPYVVHPTRVAEILAGYDYPVSVVCAGFLHDVIEDAGVTLAEVRARFGDEVAGLVEQASEPDKELPWRERKQHTIDGLGGLSCGARGLVAADKLDNARSLAETFRLQGPETWKRFNVGRNSQHWYYRSVAAGLLTEEPDNSLFRTLDFEVQALFPDERHETRFFAGKPLGNPHDARAYLADPIKHWKPRHSASELARAWIVNDGAPPVVDRLIRKAFGEYELVEGFFEKQTKLDDLGRPSQTDLLLLLHTAGGLAVVGVEGKAKESFGPLAGSPKINQQRLDGLRAKLDLGSFPVDRLRYQLMHRTVATLLEAERYHARHALLLVHAFPGANRSLGDFEEFVHAVQLGPLEKDLLSQSKNFGGVKLRLGWATAP